MKSKLAIALFIANAPQYEIADAAGMSETRLSRIALGRIVPTAEERRQIARALKKAEAELFPREGQR